MRLVRGVTQCDAGYRSQDEQTEKAKSQSPQMLFQQLILLPHQINHFLNLLFHRLPRNRLVQPPMSKTYRAERRKQRPSSQEFY